MSTTVDPSKASSYVASATSEIATLRAIADWAQEQADDAWNAVHRREAQLSEMLRTLAERGWSPEGEDQ